MERNKLIEQLGSNLKERGINKEQLLLMLKYGQINVTDNFEITYSDINSYITNNSHSYESYS